MAGKYVGSMFVPDTPSASSKTQQEAAGILGLYSDPKNPFVLFAQETDSKKSRVSYGNPKNNGCRLC